MSDAAVISATDLADFTRAALIAAGLDAEAAARAADVVVEADLRGIDSHGINHIVGRIEDFRAGRIHPNAVPLPLGSLGAMAWYDGQQGYAPAQVPTILPHLVELTNTSGIGMIFLRDTSHWGCPAYYARWLALRSLVGMAMTNTNPAMPLWGATAKSVGNNPIAIAAPRRDAPPIVLDMAMQQISWGGLKIAETESRRLPGHWGYDDRGQPTDDPALINQSGRVRPMGDHKGSGLAFMLEILTGILSGGQTNSVVGKLTAAGEPAHYCQSFLAIRPGAVDGMESFFDEVEYLYATAKAAPLADGFDTIALPGDRSNATMEERLRVGIPLGRIRASLDAIAKQTGVALPSI